MSAEQKSEAQSHLDKHKKAAGIGAVAEESKEPFRHAWKEQNEIEFQVAPEPSIDELIESIEDIVKQINVRLDALEAAQKPPKQPPAELEEAKKTVEVLKAQIEVLEDQNKVLKEELERVKKPGEAIISSNVTSPRDMIPKKAIEAVLPPDWIARAWGLGPQRFVQDIKRVLRQSGEA